MSKTKVAISLDRALVTRLDKLVRSKKYASRSAAVEASVRSHLHLERDRAYDALLEGIDMSEERGLADERFGADAL